MSTTTTTPVTQSELDAFVAAWQEYKNAYYAKTYARVGAPVITVERGRRFAKFIANDSQRSCIGFVELATGDLYKAATWKAPALNFTRGNIRTTKPEWWYAIQ